MSQSPSKPLSFNSPRASPFRRPESPMARSPSTVRAATPSASPTKLSAPALDASPMKPKSPSLSPEKHNPFGRRPSQLGHERPSSPFARPSSRLSVVESPARALSFSRGKSPDTARSQTPRPASPTLAAEPPSPSPLPPSPSPQPTQTTALGNPIFMDGPSNSPPSHTSPSPSHPSSYAAPAPSSRPVAHRTITASTSATVRPFNLKSPANTPKPPLQNLKLGAGRTGNAGVGAGAGNYAHLPQALLRSMRESFEVLDNANSGTVDSANLASLLDQLGMDSSPRALSEFFPPNAPSNLNLARYLDTLAAAHSQLSQADELAAAFGAFDVDDSGQVDLAELRDALLHTAPEPGAEHLHMSEQEVDAIMNDFSARRAFGGKGLFGKDINRGGGKKRGDVFRYRDFMASVAGGGENDLHSDQLEVA